MDKSMRAELAELWEFYFQIEPCLVYQPQTSTQISATYKHQVTFCVWTQISATYKQEQHEPQVTFCVWTQISATYKHEQHKPQVTFCVWTQISATYKHEHHKPQVTFCVWTQISATFLTKHVNTVQFDSSNTYIGQKYKLKNSQIRDF